jgi:hypothetical protein
MISIIICSRTQTISSDYLKISKILLDDYELVVIDNSENTYSIFEAYNLGIEQSKGSICVWYMMIFAFKQLVGEIS